MKSIRAWLPEFAALPVDAEVTLVEGRGGKPTLRVRDIFLHSRYQPEQEAQRLIESAELDLRRPVLVIGLGLGYHVLELQRLGFDVAVAEPNPAVARLALEHTLGDADFPLLAGDIAACMDSPAFRAFARRIPQLFVHPPTARVADEAVQHITRVLAAAILGAQHLSIAVVGPMYGGSLPITEYIANGFRKLGHRVLTVDNSAGWDLYQAMTGSIHAQAASAQMGQMFANLLSEWTYARVVEFDPEICLVMAQAPVGVNFPQRLANRGIVSAFWYVENWRHLPYWQQIAPQYDSFFHIQPGEFEEKLSAAGCRHHAFVQTGCDPDVHRPVTLAEGERDTYACDLSFAGAGYYNRLQFFRGLTDYDFKIWGVNWPDRELAKRVVGGERRFENEDFMKMVAGARINFNLHSSNVAEGVDPDCDALNPRIFEIAAAGGFQICDPCKGLENHFDLDQEIPVYRNLQEARKLVDHFLAHPEERQAFAQRAQARAIAGHTYTHRAQAMLEHLFERHRAAILKRGIRVQRTVGEMLDTLPQDHLLCDWLKELPPEVLFLQDSLIPFLRPAQAARTYPEQVFAYMKEVREFATAILREKR